jgi:hypothetical protein
LKEIENCPRRGWTFEGKLNIVIKDWSYGVME